MRLLFLSITSRCNRSCDYCPIRQWRNTDGDNLTLDRCKLLIELAKPTHAEITGGEPTLVPWLGELCDYMESRKIVYLVKSNGHNRCKNQITAWHDTVSFLPKNYDKILIIKDTTEWEQKEKYCQENNIWYGIIGKDNDRINKLSDGKGIATLFLCPDGHLKACHRQETDHLRSAHDIGTEREQPIKWKTICDGCKSVDDFLLFLEGR